MRNWTLKSVLSIWIVAATAGCDSNSTDNDRLLPTSEAKLISIEAALDGRAVALALTNDSEWVLTSVEVVCKAKPISQDVKGCWVDPVLGIDTGLSVWQATGHAGMPPRPPQPEICNALIFGPPEVLRRPFRIKAKAHSLSSLYAELDKDNSVGTCYLAGHRGHKSLWYDIF